VKIPNNFTIDGIVSASTTLLANDAIEAVGSLSPVKVAIGATKILLRECLPPYIKIPLNCITFGVNVGMVFISPTTSSPTFFVGAILTAKEIIKVGG
jgi:hypothetical protein